jgi:DNA-binding response OmpR family regulator
MPRALICSGGDLSPELAKTALWRAGVERLTASSFDQARMMAVAGRPDLVVIDRDLPRAVALVGALRQDEATRHASIAIVARGDFQALEIELLEAGANAVLRLPAGPEWDERLMLLVTVPQRRDARFPVRFRVHALLQDCDTVGATALNVSRNGLLLETRLDALSVGEEVDLEALLPGEEEPLPAQGRVVRQAGPGQFGVQFLRIGDEARERIDTFVLGTAAA